MEVTLKIKGWDLKFFNSGEWQVANERLKDLEKINRPVSDGYCPGRSNLFAALRAIARDDVRVAIIGQDPYPNPKLATGLAFSIPSSVAQSEWPPTLKTFLTEYSTDLRLPLPSSGDLVRWTERGVLLWNAIPSCGSGQSLSHDWPDQAWDYLTREIVATLAEKGITFALLGQVARRYLDGISVLNNNVLCTSHPSPRGSFNSKSPFVGSRLFSSINDKLNDNGQEPIEWRL